MISVLFAVLLLTVPQKNNVAQAEVSTPSQAIDSIQIVGGIPITEKLGSIYDGGKRITSGRDPDCARQTTGTILCLFSNEFQGTENIYSVTRRSDGTWTLPIYVSHNSFGHSRNPRVAISETGIHAVWQSDLPGYWTTYLGGLSDSGSWLSAPLPNGKGQNPSLASGNDGSIAVAWDDVLGTGESEILLVHIPSDVLPMIISDVPGVRADVYASLPITQLSNPAHPTGQASEPMSEHPPARYPSVAYYPIADDFRVVWYEEGGFLRYAHGSHRSWTWPETIATDLADSSPQITRRLFGITAGWLTNSGQLLTKTSIGANTTWEAPVLQASDIRAFSLNEEALAWVSTADLTDYVLWPPAKTTRLPLLAR